MSVSTTGAFASVVPAAVLEVPNSTFFFNLLVVVLTPLVPSNGTPSLGIFPFFKASRASSLFATIIVLPLSNSNSSSFSIFLIKSSNLVIFSV